METQGGPAQESVLLVEDEDLLRWSIQHFLERRGLAVDAVADGGSALERLAARSYAVVVTDLAITGGDGLALAAEARRRHPGIPVVIITGQGSKETVLQALRQGIADYIEKPFDLEVLFLTVVKAIEKAHVHRELERLSRTDGLTELYNRRHLHATLEAEIGRARRQGKDLSLLLVDVDDFKRYNDRFGHLAGDAALVRIGSCLKRACRRDIDTAYRYGGDEFVLILPEAALDVAADVARRVRELLVEEGLALTVSVGAAQLGEGQDLKALIREADAAMYRTKEDKGTEHIPIAS